MSVVVCTYSRARMEQMLATLRSLEQQTYSTREVILVVDNNPELAGELLSTLAGVRVIENTGPKGLSGARNTGVQEARGAILAFIDDDATAHLEWIEGLVAEYPDDGVLGVGGGVVPAWDGGRKPSWLPEEFLWVVGCSYRGLEAGAVRNPIGCNMSFRSLVFEAVGGFDPLVGRIGLAPTGCEETELCIRALNHWPNAKIMYVPRAEVRHHVPRSRQTFGYFLSRCFSEGKSKAAVSKLAGVKSLGKERQYILSLGAAVLCNLRQAFLLKDLAGGLSRAGATIAGAAAVGGGFLIANARLRLGLVSGQERAKRDQVRGE